MAEYSEYQRPRNHTARKKKEKNGYGKKFLRQLIVSVAIFAAVHIPVLPAGFKEAVKSVLSNSVDTAQISEDVSRFFKNAVIEAFTKNEENLNEDTEQSEKSL